MILLYAILIARTKVRYRSNYQLFKSDNCGKYNTMVRKLRNYVSLCGTFSNSNCFSCFTKQDTSNHNICSYINCNILTPNFTG